MTLRPLGDHSRARIEGSAGKEFLERAVPGAVGIGRIDEDEIEFRFIGATDAAQDTPGFALGDPQLVPEFEVECLDPASEF